MTTLVRRSAVAAVLRDLDAGRLDHDAALDAVRALPPVDPGRDLARSHLVALGMLAARANGRAVLPPGDRVEVDDDTLDALDRWAPASSRSVAYNR